MQLDLNLLTALDALLEEGSVAGAAARLHVTSPAMSRTLGRIRRATGDQILVRTGRAMVPTPYALEIRAEVHGLVHQAHRLLAGERELDLTSLGRTFTVRWHDALASACGPALLAAVNRQAPGVRLRLFAESNADTPELRRGEIDLESSTAEPSAPDLRHQLVGEDHLVLAVRPGHPLTEGPLTPERYAAAGHVTVSRRGRLRDPVDDALAVLGYERQVIAAAPSTATALPLVLDTDLVVTVPQAVTGSALSGLGLRVLPLPLTMPPIPLHLVWHRRHDSDRAHAWLRAQARSALLAVFGDEHRREPVDGARPSPAGDRQESP
ncbi:LysR family transcriptional regulator [Streptomyces tsukubensis]|uniref:LysR family transcriptional regulator n=1 Tax=Streptomyces tsukubensis TaxID=83656 RepID=A0A1V4AAM2_9ACTN|nr:LysR family transcriptional regulator [Streptomyces tsukubensis]OON80117.1 LysR family transcriptional regulator [Streptomyces tsukubensis]QFR97346.1 LysR family transcriptional regulator [Streptomyces tsukubensis]